MVVVVVGRGWYGIVVTWLTLAPTPVVLRRMAGGERRATIIGARRSAPGRVGAVSARCMALALGNLHCTRPRSSWRPTKIAQRETTATLMQKSATLTGSCNEGADVGEHVDVGTVLYVSNVCTRRSVSQSVSQSVSLPRQPATLFFLMVPVAVGLGELQIIMKLEKNRRMGKLFRLARHGLPARLPLTLQSGTAGLHFS
ncbi:hypothetical protein IWX91DRAFT_181641 [Phyllosticta citricarpa]